MFKWVNYILDLGTDAPRLLPYEKHSVRLINGICFFITIAKIIEDIFTFRLGDLNLIYHSLFSNITLILILFLNYKKKIRAAKATFTALLLLVLVSIPFTVQHSLNADGLFLVFLVIFFAIYNNAKTIIGLTVFVAITLLAWHVADHYSLLQPAAILDTDKTLYIEIVYTIMMIILMGISLLTFKKSTSDYQRELTQNIQQKDILIKEVHHRVKNNLQVVISMLGIRETNAQSAETLDVIRDIKARVVAMSIIHNKLYSTNDFQYVELNDYISELFDLLADMYNSTNITLKKTVNIDRYQTNLTFSIPLGLIITEVISNSMKHAFVPGKSAQIEVSGRKHGESFTLRIKDNGKGMDLGGSTKKSLGFLMINILCKQIDAELERINDQGLETIITFKP